MPLKRFRKGNWLSKQQTNPQSWGDIFNPSSYPEYSYKPRTNDDASRIITTLTQTSSGWLSITGMSRTGKTCLMEYCLRETEIPYILLAGAKIKSIDDFWFEIASQLNTDNKTEVESGWSVEAVIAFLKLGYSRSVTTVRDNLGNSEALEDLNEQNLVIIIDDFHHIPEKTRFEVLYEIQKIVFSDRKKRIKFALLYVPTREMNKSWKGKSELWNERIDSVAISLWSTSELASIGMINYLNHKRSVLGLENLAKESFGLPSIMQRYCREYCVKFLLSTDPNVQSAVIDKDQVGIVFQNVADNLWELAGGEQFYRQLISGGPKNMNADAPITFRDGRKGNINMIIWYSLSKLISDLMGKTSIQVEGEALISYLEQYTDFKADTGSKRKVRNRLEYMSNQATEEYEKRHKELSDFVSDPFFEYDKSSDLITIYNPSYMVALRHSMKHNEKLTRYK